MSEIKKIATRESYRNALVELGKIFDFPDRFFDCGIAEANLIGVAAGRAFEQIRNTIGYPHLNVKICATHGGISVSEDSASHQCCEDFALIRSIPGMVVMSPADDVEAQQMIHAAYQYEGPAYIRFGRLATSVFHDENYKFEIGKSEFVRDGKGIAIITKGLMVY